MKKTALWLGVALLLSFAPFAPAGAGDSKTLTGEFVWSARDKSGDLEAIFTETGDGQWDVDFHFTFRGSAHVYSGTAEGSLSDGDLQGRVLNESQKRTFVFRGSFTDGAFSGTHAEIDETREQATGTLTLRGD